MPFTVPSSESVVASAVAQASEPLAVIGPDGTFLYANGEFIQLLGGVSEADLLGRAWENFFDDATSSRPAEKNSPGSGPSSRGFQPWTARSASGEERTVDVLRSPLPDGRCLAIVLKSSGPAPVADGHVVMPREFLSKISHEFRTPLATMQGVLYLLQKDLDLSPGGKRQRWLDHLRESMGRLRELADQVLEWNRLEGAAVKSHRGSLDVAAFLARIAAHADEHAGSARCRVEVAADAPSVIVVNEALLRTVLDQFLANALKFSPADRPVRLTVARRGESVRFTVIDQGRGIPLTEHPSMWQPFFRGSNAANEPGSGLGLMLARRAANLLGGSVGFQAEPGDDTSFWIEIAP